MERIVSQAVCLALVALTSTAFAAGPNGFDLRATSIPPQAIVSGGPPRDGIPSIDHPKFVPAQAADFLGDGDLVIGLAAGKPAKAYPLRILNWHEIVNDMLDGRPVAVTYCPLTASAVVFERRLDGELLEFGVSGLLYESNVLLYDRQSESLWSQLAEHAVAGARNGTPLNAFPSLLVRWKTWRTMHPDTLVLTTDTGALRDYDRNPYAAYEGSGSLMFRPSELDARLKPKEKVLGVVAGGEARAYPFSELDRAGGSVVDLFGGRRIEVRLDGNDAALATAEGGEPVNAIRAYWFAWYVFHPETTIWRAQRPEPLDGPVRTSDIRIEETRSYWTRITAAVTAEPDRDPFGRGGLFVVSGTLRNVSDLPVHHVRLAFELVDRAGTVVYREEGFNRFAEALMDAENGIAPQEGPDAEIREIPPGGTDSYRMIFIGEEIPEFDHAEVRVVSAR